MERKKAGPENVATRTRDGNDQDAAQPTKRVRESDWLHAHVTRWSELVWKWIVRILGVAVVVLLALSVLWTLDADEGTDAANTRVLEQRAFTSITQQSAPQKGAQLPVIGSVFDEGTYSVTDYGRCSFIVNFDDGAPTIIFTPPNNGGKIEVRDADPTRIHQVPAIITQCG